MRLSNGLDGDVYNLYETIHMHRSLNYFIIIHRVEFESVALDK